MLRYPTQSDHRYGDATNNAMPQGSNTYWPPNGLDTSQPAVTRDPEDRHPPSRLRASQLASPAAYASSAATPPFSLTHRDSYSALGQTQIDCPDQFAYHPQQYLPSVNYAAPPYDLAEYPVGYPLCPHDPADYSPSISFRPFQVVLTIVGSIPASPQHPLPTSSIHPRILIPFTTPQHMTPRSTSMPMATTACHLAANITHISKIWSQILRAIYAVVPLIITKLLPNTPPFPFLHLPVLQSLAMLWWISRPQSPNPQAGPPFLFPVSLPPPNLYQSKNRLKV